MMRIRIYGILLILLLSVILGACSPLTTLTLTWNDDTYSKVPLTDVLVLGISEDPLRRRLFEDSFVQAFTKQGSQATASYRVLPSSQKLDQDRVKHIVSSSNFQVVLATHLLGVDEEEVYHPPRSYIVPRSYFVGGIYRHYVTIWDYIHEPGYYSQHVAVRLETNIYDAATERLVWSARSETLDPNSTTELIESTVNTITDKLREQKFLR